MEFSKIAHQTPERIQRKYYRRKSFKGNDPFLAMYVFDSGK